MMITRLSSSKTPMKFLIKSIFLKIGSCLRFSVRFMNSFSVWSSSYPSIYVIIMASLVSGTGYFFPYWESFLEIFRLNAAPTLSRYFLRFSLKIFWIWVFVNFYFFNRTIICSFLSLFKSYLWLSFPFSDWSTFIYKESASPSL